MKRELAMDLGTANTIIISDGEIVVNEPSVVALDPNTEKTIAVGERAKLMYEKTREKIRVVRPLHDGVIADFNACEQMMRGLIGMVHTGRRLFTPSIRMVIGVPSGSTEVELRAVRDSAEHAGGRDVYLIFEPMAAAIGIGLDVNAPEGNMVVDIGDEVTALSDATSAAITRHDKDIVDLAQAGLKATEALEANRKDIDANKQGIVDLAKGLQLAAEAVEDNRKEIDANKAAIETKADKADFEELAKYTADMGKKVNDIGDEVTALSDATSAAITRHDKDIVDLAQAGLKATEALEANRKDIDANKKYIGDLALAGKAAADALEANRQDIDANKAAIAENTAKLEEQKEANDGFNNAIASLDEDIITLKKADLAAADALKAHRTDIDANKAAIETKADKTAVESVRTIAVEAQKSAQVAKSAVEVAQKSAETADSHAKAAQTAAAKAQESADTNAVQIAANTKQIDTNKTDIAALQTANGQHAAGIAKNSARIDSLDKNVANLRKETRQGLAAQAALSGLFQPYSVGKFNVTAALGGFKSDTAVAVGAGYRFNENFAAKAGLAVGTSSGGSASYNVGLNYEW